MEYLSKHPPMNELEDRIGYHFKDPMLLTCALTHSSYANEQKVNRHADYERIEFLGDAVLELLSSEYFYKTCPGKREGELTRMRSSLVCEVSLAKCARELKLPDHILFGKGAEACGGRSRDSILADVLEAILGAMYLDSNGLEEPRRFLQRFLLTDVQRHCCFTDYKSVLQEEIQKSGGCLEYHLLDESGPGHQRRFTVEVLIGGEPWGLGEGGSKKEAEQKAALEALKARGILSEHGSEHVS